MGKQKTPGGAEKSSGSKKGTPVQAPAGIKKAKAKTDKPAPKKQAADEIEDIFTTGKQKKAEAGEAAAAAAAAATAKANDSSKAAKAAKKVEGSKDDIFGADVGKGRKKTEEGWNVYSEAELGLIQGGGDTDLCPFDCQCCF